MGICSFLFSLLSSIPGTLFGSWFGARFAFKYNKEIKFQEKIDKEVERCKYVQFVILTHIHFTRILSTNLKNSNSQADESSILLRRWEYIDNLTSFDFEKLSFLLNKQDPMILYKLFLHERKFLELRECLKKRDDFLAGINTKTGPGAQILPLNENVLTALKRTDLSGDAIFSEFHDYLEKRYPEVDFLSIQEALTIEQGQTQISSNE